MEKANDTPFSREIADRTSPFYLGRTNRKSLLLRVESMGSGQKGTTSP